MKISILINEFNIRGGTHKQVHRLVEYLMKQGHAVTIFTKIFDPSKCYPGIENFKVISYEKYFLNNSKSTLFNKLLNKVLGSFKIAKQAFRSADFINVHDNGFGLVMWILKALSFRRNVPIVWQINDLPPVFLLGNSKGQKEHWSFNLRRRFYQHVAKNVDQITVNVTKNALRVKKNLFADAKVLYCGVDLRSTILPKKEFDHKNISLLSTGVFLEYRNYETFLKVHDKLITKGFNVKSTIIGSTALNLEYAKKIKDLIDKKHLDCTLTGDITESELIKIYENSDFFLFLNIDQSWGLAVFEAMNLGLPVIVSNSVGATELLTNDINSIIVEPKDSENIASKIALLMEDPVYRQNIINNAFNSVINMTWDEMYSKEMERLLIYLTNNQK